MCIYQHMQMMCTFEMLAVFLPDTIGLPHAFKQSALMISIGIINRCNFSHLPDRVRCHPVILPFALPTDDHVARQ